MAHLELEIVFKNIVIITIFMIIVMHLNMPTPHTHTYTKHIVSVTSVRFLISIAATANATTDTFRRFCLNRKCSFMEAVVVRPTYTIILAVSIV